MKALPCLAMLMCLAGAGEVAGQTAGQTDEKVFDGASVTTSELVEALTPPEEPVRTRSIRAEHDDAPPAPVKPAKASLLITFETNSAALTGQARRSLDVVGEALQSPQLAEHRFLIQGHADPRGTPEKNLQLSQLRAESVRRYLVANKHIRDERLQAIGKGDTELMNRENPIAPENRRVSIVNLAGQ